MGEIRKQTAFGIKWTLIERFSIQGVQFLLSIIIARLLTPADYGLIGMLGIFLAISQTFINSGMPTALIRKIDVSQTDFSTVFYFNIIVSIFFALTLFFCSPYIAEFFNQPILSSITKLLSLNLIISAFGAVQSTQLTIKLNFKRLAKINFISAITSGLSCLVLAYLNFGVWALAWQAIISNVIRVTLLWCGNTWRPSWIFSKESFKRLFGFGSRLLGANLVNTIYNQSSTILIGKFYTPVDLGDYARGQSIASLPTNTISGTMESVTFPILSKLQEDKIQLLNVYKRYINLTMMLTVFLMFLLVTLAKPIVLFLLTSKWSGAIIFLQIYVFAAIVDPICLINVNLLKVIGRSDLVFKLEIIKKSIALALLFASVPFGVKAICWSVVIYSQIALFLNTYYTGKLFNLGYWLQIKGFIPYIIYSIIACIPPYILALFCPWNFITIIIGSLLSFTIYICLLHYKQDSLYKEYVQPYLMILSNKLKNIRL